MGSRWDGMSKIDQVRSSCAIHSQSNNSEPMRPRAGKQPCYAARDAYMYRTRIPDGQWSCAPDLISPSHLGNEQSASPIQRQLRWTRDFRRIWCPVLLTLVCGNSISTQKHIGRKRAGSAMATQTDTYQAAQSNRNLTAGGSPPLEKDFENGYHLDNNMDAGAALQRIKTSGSLSISPELFEKIYLSPQNRVAGELRKTFGNPTPLALAGFLLSLTPLSCILMGWRGAGGNGASDIGAYFFFGGLLMVIGSVGEWIIGNTFPFVVFGCFGAFWLTFAATLQPFYNAVGAFEDTGGVASPVFNASFGFFLLAMGFLCFIFLICALRTNVAFVIIFLTLVAAFCCLAGAYWHTALGNASTAKTLILAAGALTFVTDVAGWWIFFAILLASLDFPFQLPVGDLSHIIKGASEKAKIKEQYSA
nr:protein alcs [Quercus suber]